MKRRHFLQSMALSSGIVIPFGRDAWAATGGAAGTDTGTDTSHQRKLIVVMLRGAVDGLSVVAPYGDSQYLALRPGIGIARPGKADGLIDLDGYFGLHPALGDLQTLWREKKLAFIHASGSPDPSRSHFDAQDYLESGTPGRKSTQDGWMNRLVATLPGASAPTRAISIGPVMPRILTGAAVASNIASGASGGKANVLDRPRVGNAFDQMYGDSAKFGKTYQDAKDAHQEVMQAANADDARMEAADAGGLPPNGFPDNATRLATLFRNDPNIQMAFIALGGWDTHANQGNGKGQLANKLAPLGQGLAILAKRLGPMLNDTTIVVMSEFGRTARQNGNGGTDHGHGNVMWVIGGNVKGGRMIGDWPGLASNALYEGRDLAVTTDFRTVLAQIAQQHLRLSDKQLSAVFPVMPERAGNIGLFTV